jgi:hypothetical protein
MRLIFKGLGMIVVISAAAALGLLARVEYFSHTLRFHDTGLKHCDGDETCDGHLVCETCEEVVWDRANDPWRGLTDVEDDDTMGS